MVIKGLLSDNSWLAAFSIQEMFSLTAVRVPFTVRLISQRPSLDFGESYRPS